MITLSQQISFELRFEGIYWVGQSDVEWKTVPVSRTSSQENVIAEARPRYAKVVLLKRSKSPTQMQGKYPGGVPWSDFNTCKQSLNLMQKRTWSHSLQLRQISHGIKNQLETPSRPTWETKKWLFYDLEINMAPEETELMEASADRPLNMAPHGQVSHQHDADTKHWGRRCDRSHANARRVGGVEVEALSAGCTRQKVCILWVKP